MQRILTFLAAFILLFVSVPWPLIDTAYAATCSLNIYPQPTPGTHRYTVTVTNPTSTPAYSFINNYWVDGQPAGNPQNPVTSTYNYWSLGTGLGYSVSGWAGTPVTNESFTYQTDLTVGSTFNGVDVAVFDKAGNSICSQGHDVYTVSSNDLGIVIPPPAVSNLPPPTPANCSLNIYPQPTPGTHRYTVTLTNNTATPGYKFINNFWVDGAPSGFPANAETESGWVVHAIPPSFLPYQVTGTAGSPIAQSSITYQTDLTVGSTFDGVDIALISEGSGTFDICSQGHDTYTVTYNPPVMGISAITSRVTEFYNDGSITKLGNSIYDKLTQAKNYIDAGDYAQATSTLQALIKQIKAQIDIHITAQAGSTLIATIESLINSFPQ
jgi:hypothetical protein